MTEDQARALKELNAAQKAFLSGVKKAIVAVPQALIDPIEGALAAVTDLQSAQALWVLQNVDMNDENANAMMEIAFNHPTRSRLEGHA